MVKYVIRRLLGLLPLLFGVLVISFLLMKAAPGGPQVQLAGNKSISQAEIDSWLRRWCLSRDPSPLSALTEFGGWLGVLNCDKKGTDAFFSTQGGLNILPAALGGGDNGILHGDFGTSISAGRPVLALITERIPATLVLTITALILWVGIAIIAGVYAAVHRYSLFDQVLTFFSYVFFSPLSSG